MFRSATLSTCRAILRGAGWFLPRHDSQFMGLLVCASPGLLIALSEGAWLLGGAYWAVWHLVMAAANAADDLSGGRWP